MDASAWIALASLAGFGLLQTALIAYFMGGLTQRVKTLEEHKEASGSTDRLMGGLEATVDALKSSVEKLDHTVNNMLQGKIVPARRSGAE